MKSTKDMDLISLIKNDFSLELFIHSNNVANIALTIANDLQLQPTEKIRLYEEALYHDIGKSKIPESILYKKGKLSPEEWEIMKEHAVYSEALYLSIVNLNRINIEKAKVIRHHHENWDGTGYPDNIMGESIPLHSRIIRIADIFDAITQPRVYRPYKMDNPLEIIEISQGKEIDPYIFKKCYQTLKGYCNYP